MTETDAKQDLAIMHYPGKWRSAVFMVTNQQVARRDGEDYWSHVRRTYLELGGEFVQQLCMRQQIQYWEPTILVQ